MSAEDVVTTKPSSFSSGVKDVTVTEDAYGGGIAGFNMDDMGMPESPFDIPEIPSADSLSDSLPKPGEIAKLDLSSSVGAFTEGLTDGIPKIDPELANIGELTKSGMSIDMACAASKDFQYISDLKDAGTDIVEVSKKTSSILPKGLNLKDLGSDLDLRTIADTLPRIKNTLSSGDYSSLGAEGLTTMIKDSSSLTKRILAGDSSLGLDDLTSGNGSDYAIMGAAGIYGVAALMGKNDGNNIFGILHKVKVPEMFADTALGMLVDKAAEYGLGDLVESLIGVVNDKYFAKSKHTVRSLLSGFRYRDKVVVNTLSKNEKGLITSIGGVFGLNKDNQDAVIDILEQTVAAPKELDKEAQGKRFVDSLFKIDKKWLKGYRSGDPCLSLDLLRYCSRDALDALLRDERTIVAASVYKTYRPLKRNWGTNMRRWNKGVYI